MNFPGVVDKVITMTQEISSVQDIDTVHVKRNDARHFFLAVRDGDTQACRQFLETGKIDCDRRFFVGGQWKPLICLCAEQRNFQLVSLLLEFKVSVNQPDSDGKTALHWAMGCCHNMVSLLVEYGSDVNARDRRGRTPLHYATLFPDSLRNVRILLENGAEIDPVDGSGFTPLLECASYRKTTLIHLLLQYGANPNILDLAENSALFYAIALVDIEMFALLLKYNACPDAIITPLQCAIHVICDIVPVSVRYQFYDIVCRHGCDTNQTDSFGRNVLHYLCLQDDLKSVDVLLRAGCQVNITGSLRTPLMEAFNNGNEDLIRRLISDGGMPTDDQLRTLNYELDRAPSLKQLAQLLRQPRSLQEISRRAFHTGRLGRLLNSINLPKKIQNYLLYKS